MNDKQRSPFTPGNPVPIEFFVGRSYQINQIMRSIEQSCSGRQQNIFLVGERGVGKTSVASFVRHWAINDENVLGVHVFLGGVDNLKELVRRIFEAFVKSGQGKKWFEHVRGFFGDFIKDVGLFGVTVGFNPPQRDLTQLVRNFPQSLKKMISELKEEVSSILIILDDLDTLSEVEEFANWYKSAVDEIATQFDAFPITFLLIGLPEIVDSLAQLQPSLPRIFRIIELSRLTDEEVEEFFHRTFESVGVKVDDDAMELFVKFSSGVPVIMQEIGDAAYWFDQDKHLEQDDALVATLSAAQQIGRKYLDPQVYRAIRSNNYRSILRKIGMRETPISRSFTRSGLAERLTEKEKNVLDNFLRRLRKLGVIELDREMGRGCYRFVNDIYPIYVYMEARAFLNKG